MDAEDTSVWGTSSSNTCRSSCGSSSASEQLHDENQELCQNDICSQSPQRSDTSLFADDSPELQTNVKCEDNGLCFCTSITESKKYAARKRRVPALSQEIQRSSKRKRQCTIANSRTSCEAEAKERQLKTLNMQVHFMRSCKRLSDHQLKDVSMDLRSYVCSENEIPLEKCKSSNIITSTPKPTSKFVVGKKCQKVSSLVKSHRQDTNKRTKTVHIQTSTPRVYKRKNSSPENHEQQCMSTSNRNRQSMNRRVKKTEQFNYSSNSDKSVAGDRMKYTGKKQKKITFSTPKRASLRTTKETKSALIIDPSDEVSETIITGMTVFGSRRLSGNYKAASISPVSSTPCCSVPDSKPMTKLAHKKPKMSTKFNAIEKSFSSEGAVSEKIGPCLKVCSVNTELSVPTTENKVTQKSSRISSDGLNCDASFDEDHFEDDDDLPPGLTPVKHEDRNLASSDIIWVKWKKELYLPAMVKNVYKKKNRLTCIMFSPKKEIVTLNYRRSDSIFPYSHPKKDHFQKVGTEMENLEDRKYFRDCIDMVLDYLAKKALDRLPGNDLSYFQKDGYEAPASSTSPWEEEEDIEDKQVISSISETCSSDEEPCFDCSENDFRLSNRGKIRKERLKQKSQVYTDFITSDNCKRHLVQLLKGEVVSDIQHTFFHGTTKERARLKHKGFGPIDDDDQIERVVTTYTKWLNEVNTDPYLHKVSYIFDVWIPEAIVFAFQSLHKYSKKQSWEKFYRGVARTKEEIRLMHEDMLGNMRKESDSKARKADDSAGPLPMFTC